MSDPPPYQHPPSELLDAMTSAPAATPLTTSPTITTAAPSRPPIPQPPPSGINESVSHLIPPLQRLSVREGRSTGRSWPYSRLWRYPRLSHATNTARSPTWGQLKKFPRDAMQLIQSQRPSPTVGTVFLAMLAVIACQVIGLNASHVYWAYIPEPPVLFPATWQEDVVETVSNSSMLLGGLSDVYITMSINDSYSYEGIKKASVVELLQQEIECSMSGSQLVCPF